MLAVLERYLVGYRNYIVKNKNSEALQLWDNLKLKFERGYNKISECYSQGITVQRNKAMSKVYRSKAETIAKTMRDIAMDNPI